MVITTFILKYKVAIELIAKIRGYGIDCLNQR